ncbi:uncharacterized protein LOC111115862 isoform X2 [Crassostrea virginica]
MDTDVMATVMAFCFSCASDEKFNHEFCFDEKGKFSYLGHFSKQDYYTCERKCSVMIDEFNTCRHSNSWITVHLTIGGKMYTYDVCLHSTVYLDVSINCSEWEIDAACQDGQCNCLQGPKGKNFNSCCVNGIVLLNIHAFIEFLVNATCLTEGHRNHVRRYSK